MKLAGIAFLLFISLVGCAEHKVLTEYERLCEQTKYWGMTKEEVANITSCPRLQ